MNSPTIKNIQKTITKQKNPKQIHPNTDLSFSLNNACIEYLKDLIARRINIRSLGGAPTNMWANVSYLVPITN